MYLWMSHLGVFSDGDMFGAENRGCEPVSRTLSLHNSGSHDAASVEPRLE